ncbi:hypothetical protein BH23ACT11_BH23ACT11_04000 [soil metagenome]
MSRSSEQKKMKRAIYACDVGSTRAGNFGWVRVEPDTPKEIKGCSEICALVTKIKEDLEHGYSIALGFEAPLFIPVPQGDDDLSKGRKGEGNRPFSAQAGAYVTTLGMHQAAWVLREIYCSCGGTCTFTLDRKDWPPTESGQELFCWEAYVSALLKAKVGKNRIRRMLLRQQWNFSAKRTVLWTYTTLPLSDRFR